MNKSDFGFQVSKADAFAWAKTKLDGLLLEERVGQLLSPRVHSDFKSADDASYKQLFDFVNRFHVGGFIFFQGEVFGQAILVNELNQASRLPLLFSQDAEWGVGMRLPEATTFPNMMAIGASGIEEHAYTVGRITAAESRAIGVRMVFAPVADLNNNPNNPIINVRAFGEDPLQVSRYVRQVIRGLQDGGVLATVKHFPGHGDTATDSHADLPVLTVTRERLDSLELIPFVDAFAAGVAAVMVGHLAIPDLDPTGVPASLSRPICTDLLRRDLGFQGLVVSDAMDMYGVQTMFDAGEAAIRAVEAGLDVLLSMPDVEAAYEGILKAVQSGRIPKTRIDESALRVLEAKALVGLTDFEECDLGRVRRTVASASNVSAALEVARDCITVLPGSGLPLALDTPVLHLTLSDTADVESVGARFKKLVREWAAPDTFHQVSLPSDPSDEAYDAVIERAHTYETVLVTAFVAVRSFSGRIGLPSRHLTLLNELLAAGKSITLVSMGSPYVVTGLDRSPRNVVLGYGSSDNVQQAAAEVVLHGRVATGVLPVTIPQLV